MLKSIDQQDEIENLQNEGKFYEIVEIILQNGAERKFVQGWSKRFLTSLDLNNFEELCTAIRPSTLIFLLCLHSKYFLAFN